MMETIIYILINVSASLWWAYIIEPGRILGFVGEWLGGQIRPSKTDAEKDLYGTTTYKWYAKILGGCYICQNFWQSIILGSIVSIDGGGFIAFAAIVFISHALIRKL